MAGQWDKYLQQNIIDEAQETGVIEPATNTRGAYVPVGATSYLAGAEVPEGNPNEIIKNRRKGKVVKRNLRQQLDASFGLPAKPTPPSSDLIQPTLERQARVEQSKIEGTATAAKGRSDRKVGAEKRRKEVAADISTTTMRMINGVAFDTDYGKPTSNLLSKGYVKPTGVDPEFKPSPTSTGFDPGPAYALRDADYVSDEQKTWQTRHDMLSGENAFNKSQEKSGGNLRSVNGITYDTTDLNALRETALAAGPGSFPDKWRAYEKEGDIVDSITSGSAKFVDSTGKKNIKKDTKNAQANGVTETSVIPKLPEKPPVDPANQDNYRPSSIVPTAPQLEGLGNTGAVENRDVDNYAASTKEGTFKQTKSENVDVTAKVKPVVEKEPFTIAGKNDVDTDVDEDLRAAGAADLAKTRSEKGQRNPKAAKVDSRTVPFDQQDLWDKEGNVRPEYQEGPSSTTMVAKKNWDIQPIYKSPELQAKHEKRQKYADSVNNTIETESLKHLDTEYASGDESKAAFARMQKRHAKLRSGVDKYHPVPAGGYFNENVDKDTSSESYEEMPGVKIQPSPQPQIAKDDSAVVPERLMNKPEEASDAQLAADDRRLRNNRTAVTGTRQLTFNNISARPTNGRTREQELVDLSQAAARNQKLEESGKRLQTHSPEVMLRARISADNAGVSPSVYNSPTFHQHPEGRIHVRDAYIRHTATIGDDAEAQANMDKYASGNANVADSRKEAAYSFMQNRERFENSKEPGTGYRYNAALGNLDIKTDKFRASNGEAIPFSQTDHPEHPGFDLEGSHVGFKGSVPVGENEDGTTKYAELKHPLTGDDIHEGFHPYNTHEGRVFEKHSIPENAIHHADIIEQGLQTGESPVASLRKLIQGKESSITANGLAINKQPAAPIKGAGGFDPKPLPAGPDFSGVPMSQGDPVPNPLYGEHKKQYRRAAAHERHEETGTIASGCRACSKKASQASRDEHAKIAGTFIPPKPRSGRVGTGAPVTDGELPTRPITKAEKANKAKIPSTDDSKSKVFLNGPVADDTSTLSERMNVGPKPEFHYGHGSLEDISAAHAGGHITGDEAYELSANAGVLPGIKPKFTKDPE